jgi:hypothetical protein
MKAEPRPRGGCGAGETRAPREATETVRANREASGTPEPSSAAESPADSPSPRDSLRTFDPIPPPSFCATGRRAELGER